MRRLALLAALALPVPAAAHPHVFIDAGLGFVFDEDGMLAAVRVEWVYDEFYTLLLFEDLGIDPDGDLKLTEDELARLKAADSDWQPEYEGDLYGLADGAPIALRPPVLFDLRLEGPRIVSTHVRPLAEPVDPRAHAVTFKAYDPGYYAAFSLSRHVLVAGDDTCRAERHPADQAAATARLEGMLKALVDEGGTAEVEFPRVGADFADEVTISCAAR